MVNEGRCRALHVESTVQRIYSGQMIRRLPLVLIAQVQRSGGTLLSQLFDGHPQVFAFPHELKWGGRDKYHWPDVNPTNDSLWPAAQRLVAANAADLEDFKRLGYKKGFNVADNERLPFRWSLGTYLSAFLWYGLTSPPHTRRDYLDIFFTAYAVALGGARSKKMVTAFTPRANFINSHPGNEEFFSDYPDGTMICICRHPADWYASASRHQKKYADVEVAMALWRESAESALVLHAKHPRQVLLLPFDDLVLSSRRYDAARSHPARAYLERLLADPDVRRRTDSV